MPQLPAMVTLLSVGVKVSWPMPPYESRRSSVPPVPPVLPAAPLRNISVVPMPLP